MTLIKYLPIARLYIIEPRLERGREKEPARMRVHPNLSKAGVSSMEKFLYAMGNGGIGLHTVYAPTSTCLSLSGFHLSGDVVPSKAPSEFTTTADLETKYKTSVSFDR